MYLAKEVKIIASIPTPHTVSKKQTPSNTEINQEEKLCEHDVFGHSSACKETIYHDGEYGSKESVPQDSEHGRIEYSCLNDQNTDLTEQNIDEIMQDCETRHLDLVRSRQYYFISKRGVYVEDEIKVTF